MTDPADPVVARRNRTLGLILGAVCLATTIAFIIIFTRSGLPKDPKVLKRMQTEAAVEAAAGSERGPR